MLGLNFVLGSLLVLALSTFTLAEEEGNARRIATFAEDGGSLLTHLYDCSESSDKICNRVDSVDLDTLVNSTFVSLPDGTVLERHPVDNIVQSDGSIFCNFRGENLLNADFVVFDGNNGEVPHADGVVRMPNGEIQELEFCEGRCQDEDDHIWMVYDGASRFGGEDGNDTLTVDGGDRMMLTSSRRSLATDRQGPMIISMFVYYTTDFKNAVPDVKGFIDQAIGETNTGLANSKVNVRIELHCWEEAVGLAEVQHSSTMLNNFRVYKGTVPNLLRTADTTMLLVNDLGSQHCGIAYFNSIANTVGVSARSCALGYYTFGHELFHNFGADHNREANGSPPGTGFLITNTNFRTVLA